MKLVTMVVALGVLLCQAPSVEPVADDIAGSILQILPPAIDSVKSGLGDIIAVTKIGMGVVRFINIISQKMFNVSLDDLHNEAYVPMADRKVLAMFEILSQRLDQVENGVHGIKNTLKDLTEGMQNMIRWEIALDTMEEYMRPIHTLYKRFTLYQELKDKIENKTLMDFAEQVVSHDSHSIMSLMSHLHNMAVPEASLRSGSSRKSPARTFGRINKLEDAYILSNNMTTEFNHQGDRMMTIPGGKVKKVGQLLFRPSLFEMLHQTLQGSSRCRYQQSPQQLVNGLLVLLTVTEAKGYAMLEFAWMILKLHNEGDFDVERDVAQSLYLQYSEDLMKEAQKILVNVSREYYRCDPQQHIDGDTHVMFTELLQGYIENEVNLNSDGTCKKQCDYYQHAQNHGCYLQSEQLCGKQRRCYGTIHDCRFYDADAWVCPSENPYRRYQYVKYESGLQLGDRGTCESSVMKVDSWWRWFVHCSYCVCLCDDSSSPTTDRFISLRPVTSDAADNMVITGVKFTKQNRVIHFKIQQALALPQGLVNTSTIHWVDVEPIDISSSEYQEGIHFKTLSFEDRSIDLDLLTAPDEHVVTGVKFRMLGSHINFEMQVTPVNYTSGKLQSSMSYWMSNDSTPASELPRRKLNFEDRSNPTTFTSSNAQDSVPNSYLTFGPTSRGSDVAQMTIPFFDAQEVSPSPSSWLSGVELFHKGQHGSGGFMSLKVHTYDITQHMENVRDENRLQHLFKPLVTVDLSSSLEVTVNEHKKGLGVLGYLKIISGKLLYGVLKQFQAKPFLMDHQITRSFRLLSNRLDQIEHKAYSIKTSLQKLADELRGVVHWEIALNTMEGYTRAITTQFNRFLLYEGLASKVENVTLLDFVKQVVSHSTYSVASVMGHLQNVAAPRTTMSSSLKYSDADILKDLHAGIPKVKWAGRDRGLKQNTKRDTNQENVAFRSSLFSMLHDAIQLTDSCNIEQSPQQLMKGLYLLLAITQARAFIMVEYAWIVLRLQGEGNFTIEQEMSEYLYMKYSQDIVTEAQRVMADESRDFYRCDPQKHIEGNTYVRFTEFLQGYIENEVNLNDKGTCKKNCAYYQHTQQKGCFLPDQQLCGMQRQCSGTIRDCKFYDADAWVCFPDNPQKRYDYIRYESGQQLGHDGLCNGTVKKVDSWYRWLVYHCSYCVCSCDEFIPTSHRYMSFLPVLSDIDDNMVVTGVKFTKVDNVIHLMIQQAQTLPEGAINASTIHWADVKPIDINSRKFNEGTDYKELTYAERSIDLDRLESPMNQVLTGLQFRILDGHINLQVRVTPVDFATGLLQAEESNWISNNNTPSSTNNPRKELQLSNPGEPSTTSTPNKEDSKPNSYLQFGPSSRDSDVAQSTVPFFDAQEVTPLSSTWLSGVDLHHKGQLGSGGFLGLKVIGYDYSQHMLVQRK